MALPLPLPILAIILVALYVFYYRKSYLRRAGKAAPTDSVATQRVWPSGLRNSTSRPSGANSVKTVV